MRWTSRPGVASEKPPVAAGLPLHRRAHRHPALGGEVLPHPDLLAVVERGRAGEGEEQAVRHPDAPRVPVEHGRHPPLEPAAVDLHRRLRTERREDLLPLRVGQLVEGELVVVAQERRPLRVGVDRAPAAEGLRQRPGVLPGHREVRRLHGDEVELHLQLVAGRPAEVAPLLGPGQVDLAQQHPVAAPPTEEGAQRLEVVMRIARYVVARGVDVLHQERHRVDPEAGQPDLQPEARWTWRSRRAPRGSRS